MKVEGMYYTRSSKGEIAMCKCGNLTPEEYVAHCQELGYDIVKASYDVKDVLEEHDFVQMEDRGIRFYEIEKDYTGKLSLRDIGWDEYEELDETNIPEIISIITHEKMEENKNKIQ